MVLKKLRYFHLPFVDNKGLFVGAMGVEFSLPAAEKVHSLGFH